MRILLAILLGVLAAEKAPNREAEQVKWAEATLAKGSVFRQQKALGILAGLSSPEADRVLLAQFRRLQKGTLPLPLWLDVLEAVARRPAPEWKKRLAEREKTLPVVKDPLFPWRECLEGGDADAGRGVFEKKVEAGCARCHAIDGQGGAIGPDLTGIGNRTDRVNILESIVFPSAVIAPGYENVLIVLKSGETVTGVRSQENRDEWEITSVVDGSRRRIPTAQMAETTSLPSAMPPGLGQILNKRDLRDLIEFLATSGEQAQ